MDNWNRLVQQRVKHYKDYGSYPKFKEEVQTAQEYQTMVDIFGKNNGYLPKGFRDRVNVLKTIFKESRQQGYMQYFPQALHILLPDLAACQFDNDDRNWDSTRERMYRMAHFDEWFVVLNGPSKLASGLWYEHPHSELLEDRRIPHILMTSKDAKHIFVQHKKNLQRLDRKDNLEKAFRNWLQLKANNKIIKIPGHLEWERIEQQIPPNEPFKMGLNTNDLRTIYEVYNEEATEKSRREFTELLYEKTEYIMRNTRLADIEREMVGDDRYHQLEGIREKRDGMIKDHISMVKGEQTSRDLYSWAPAALEDLKQMSRVADASRNIFSESEVSLGQEPSETSDSLNVLIAEVVEHSGTPHSLAGTQISTSLDTELTYISASVLPSNLQLRLKTQTISSTNWNTQNVAFLPHELHCVIILLTRPLVDADVQVIRGFVEATRTASRSVTFSLITPDTSRTSFPVLNQCDDEAILRLAADLAIQYRRSAVNRQTTNSLLPTDIDEQADFAEGSTEVPLESPDMDSPKLADQLTSSDKNNNVFDAQKLKHILRHSYASNEQNVSYKFNTSSEDQEHGLDLHILVFCMMKDEFSLQTLLEPVINTSSNKPIISQNTVTLSNIHLATDLFCKSVTFSVEPFRASVMSTRDRNHMKPLDLDDVDGFIFCYNAQRKATLGMMEYALQSLLAQKSQSFKTRPGVIMSMTSDGKDHIKEADIKTKRMFVKGFKIAQKLRWEFLVSDNLNVRLDNVLTVYGDFLEKTLTAKKNRIKRSEEDDLEWPAPLQLSSLSLRDDVHSGSIGRGSNSLLASENNIIEIISKNTQDKTKSTNFSSSPLRPKVSRPATPVSPTIPVIESEFSPVTSSTQSMTSISKANLSASTAQTITTPIPKRPAPPPPVRQSSLVNTPSATQLPSSTTSLTGATPSASTLLTVPQYALGQHSKVTGSSGKTSNNKMQRSTASASFLHGQSEHFNKPLTNCVQNLSNLLPLFIQRSTEHIEIHGKTFEGLYRIPANNRERKELIQQFDQNPYLELSRFSISTVCGGVTWFYGDKNLKCPVVPSPLAKKIAQEFGISPPPLTDIWGSRESSRKVCMRVREHIRQAVRESLDKHISQGATKMSPEGAWMDNYFPPAHYVSLKYIMLHLSRLVAHSARTKMDIHNLAMVFSPCLFWFVGAAEALELVKATEISRGIIDRFLRLAIDEPDLFDIIFPQEKAYDHENPAFVFEGSRSGRFSTSQHSFGSNSENSTMHR